MNTTSCGISACHAAGTGFANTGDDGRPASSVREVVCACTGECDDCVRNVAGRTFAYTVGNGGHALSAAVAGCVATTGCRTTVNCAAKSGVVMDADHGCALRATVTISARTDECVSLAQNAAVLLSDAAFIAVTGADARCA